MKRTSIIRRTPLSRVSAKRKREVKEYLALRESYLKQNPWCEAHAIVTVYLGGGPDERAHSQDLHHRCGRLHGNYLNPSTFVACCRGCHNWIHAHPSTARELGLLA